MLSRPTDLARQLYREALPLLDEFDHREPYRLVGLAGFDITSERPPQMELFDVNRQRLARLEQAIDAVTRRFGAGSIMRAEELSRLGGRRMGVNLDFLDE